MSKRRRWTYCGVCRRHGAAALQVAIVHDWFRVRKLLSEAVDRVRRGEVKEDDRLTGSREF
jgi:hypothetical protein